MNARTIAIAIFLLAGPSFAQTERACKTVLESPENCAHFVGCINEGKTLIFGTSRGWDKGGIYGETSEGAVCTGSWEFDGFIQKGKGNFDCTNGERADINFFSRGDTIQVITGVSITDQGNRLRLWASADLPRFFAEQFPDKPKGGFVCGSTWIPLPTVYPDQPQQ